MTRRSGDGGLLTDVMRFKRERNAALATAEVLRVDLIRVVARGWLRRPEDVGLFVDLSSVVDAAGRVHVRQLEVLLSDAVRRRPEIGLPSVGSSQ